MKKVSIVILNYLNYKDTIECVDSIIKMNYDIEGIVIVDNNSNNESFEVLSKKYKRINKIIVVKTGKNYGFAKGNNIGIHIARQKFHTDFILVVNNDVIFMQKDYLKNLLEKYSEKVGVIGSEIHSKGNKVQKEHEVYVTLWENLVLWIGDLLESKKAKKWKILLPDLHIEKKVKALHGCALLFTPDFFKYYQGFYSRTFLYNEEVILYLMCKKHNLVQKYVSNTFIYHKEDCSSELSFHNDCSAMSSYKWQSRKYAIWWIIKDKVHRHLTII